MYVCTIGNRQKNTGKADDKRKFKEIHKAVKRELNNAHNQYVQNLLDTQEPTSEEETSRVTIGRKFWDYVKSMRRENVSIATLKDEVTDQDVTHAQGKAEVLTSTLTVCSLLKTGTTYLIYQPSSIHQWQISLSPPKE